jgi:hypothetical protein
MKSNFQTNNRESNSVRSLFNTPSNYCINSMQNNSKMGSEINFYTPDHSRNTSNTSKINDKPIVSNQSIRDIIISLSQNNKHK